MNVIKRYLLIGIATVIWFLMGIIPVFANDDEQRVFDYADLLTEEQESELTETAQNIESKIETELYILTTDDTDGKSSMAFADDFGDQHAFGYEEPYGTYVILLIDLDNRVAWISTSGKAISKLSEKRVDAVLDDIFQYLPEEKFYESCEVFLMQMDHYLSEKISHDSSEYNPDLYPNTIFEYDDDPATYTNEPKQAKLLSNLGISAVIGLVIAVIVLLILLSRAKTQMTADGSTYEMQGAFQIRHHVDHYLRTTTVKHKIEKNHGGSSGGGRHTSSGGHSHGGGGRGF